ncbi:unnamed protein product [Menidia menidia]|uniref:(Atlantic silverside) hypothetical protein n=1 Tax=Menidia menidia TaxID=238744 RepID=A0A8S4BF43_9TELE|nr:unnamed protein product [Menidia menidia]
MCLLSAGGLAFVGGRSSRRDEAGNGDCGTCGFCCCVTCMCSAAGERDSGHVRYEQQRRPLPTPPADGAHCTLNTLLPLLPALPPSLPPPRPPSLAVPLTYFMAHRQRQEECLLFRVVSRARTKSACSTPHHVTRLCFTQRALQQHTHMFSLGYSPVLSLTLLAVNKRHH